ncbi:MAG: hypothetical protein M1814_004483 [Vezdaea aestivalis]|nr:MAG: hypothetical protein M1814_004483 [Vezdaea aestivalis]
MASVYETPPERSGPWHKASEASLKPPPEVAEPPMGASKEVPKEAVRRPKKPSKLKSIWGKLGLDLPTLIPMIKFSLPALISQAMYQSNAVANEYTTLGYLVSIASLLCVCILPRAKFLEVLFMNCLGTAVGSSTTLLTIYCSVKAREHTTPPQSASTSPARTPGSSPILDVPYNSSSSVVCAIWLFFLIWLANTVRGYFPQYTVPTILFCIFVVVGLTEAPHLPTMDAGISLVVKLLKTFTTAFGLALGVNLLVIPVSSRTVAFKEIAGYLGLLKGALKAQSAYVHSLGEKDMFAGPSGAKGKDSDPRELKADGGKTKKENKKKGKKQASVEVSEAQALKNAVNAITAMHVKLSGDLPYAKREVAYGKLDGDNLDEIFQALRACLLPMIGMSTVSDIFDRVAVRQGWAQPEDARLVDSMDIPRFVKHSKEVEVEQWHRIVEQIRAPFKTIVAAMNDGIDHALFVLELAKRPKSSRADQSGSAERDVEAEAAPKPGDGRFSDSMAKSMNDFYTGREGLIRHWCEREGLSFPVTAPPPSSPQNDAEKERSDINKHQLWLVLYIEHLLYSTAQAILRLDRLVDARVDDGTLKNKRLIYPGSTRLKKWVFGLFKPKDSDPDANDLDHMEAAVPIIDLGDSMRKHPKDLEHLPPTNNWQRFGNGLRAVSSFLASPQSAYGFRAACATMSIGILAYLRVTFFFFVQNRLVWALIMIAIGMSMTAGASIFGAFGRIAGTVVAMIFSYINWYIVGGKVPGVIVFLYLFLFCETYFIVKYPKFIIVAILSMVTQILIIGYQLEYVKLGDSLLSNGQKYYPVYLLAPYRLACVAGGMFVAFIWTFFPYPITARSQLRKTLGSSLFLLANFYSCVHTTVRVRLGDMEGDMTKKSSPGRRLEKNRLKVFAKCLTLVKSLHEHLDFVQWEPSIGGKFPKAEYEAIIKDIERLLLPHFSSSDTLEADRKAPSILHYFALIGYATKSFSTADASEESWIRDFARVLEGVSLTSTEVTSVLCLLSGSVTNGQPLPPYLKPPAPYKLSERMTENDPDILGVDHILEPGYAAFTVMQVASVMAHDDLVSLIGRVKGLVGVVDFSFHVISTKDGSSGSSEETLWKATTEGKDKAE